MNAIGRFLELLGAALLVGGLAALAGVGAATFGSPDILTRDQAGRLMARVFEGSIWAEGAAAGLIFLGAALRRSGETALVGFMAASLVVGHGWHAGRMRVLRERHGGSFSALDPEHADRKQFGRLHMMYNVLALVLLAQGVGVMVQQAREKREAPVGNPR